MRKHDEEWRIRILRLILCALNSRSGIVSKKNGVVRLKKLLNLARKKCPSIVEKFIEECYMETRNWMLCEKNTVFRIRSTLTNLARRGKEPYSTIYKMLTSPVVDFELLKAFIQLYIFTYEMETSNGAINSAINEAEEAERGGEKEEAAPASSKASG